MPTGFPGLRPSLNTNRTFGAGLVEFAKLLLEKLGVV